jgi:hypothetical protein
MTLYLHYQLELLYKEEMSLYRKLSMVIHWKMNERILLIFLSAMMLSNEDFDEFYILQHSYQK